jgi:FeS assembly SUF system protein
MNDDPTKRPADSDRWVLPRETESWAPPGEQPASHAPGENTPDAGGAPEAAAPVSAIPQEELERMGTDIIAALKSVYDPEIPVDIYELGLIYRVEIEDDREVKVLMTLTAPGCPVAGEMPKWVENAVGAVAGVSRVSVALTFDPPWDMTRMSEDAQLSLGVY